MDITAEVQHETDASYLDGMSRPARKSESILVTDNSFSPTTPRPGSSIFTGPTAKPCAFDGEDGAERTPESITEVTGSRDIVPAARRSLSQPQPKEIVPAPQASSNIYLDPPKWPLEDPKEATLLQHFITKVATFVSYPLLQISAYQSLSVI